MPHFQSPTQTNKYEGVAHIHISPRWTVVLSQSRAVCTGLQSWRLINASAARAQERREVTCLQALQPNIHPSQCKKLTAQLSKSTKASKHRVILVPHFHCIFISLKKGNAALLRKQIWSLNAQRLYLRNKTTRCQAQSAGMEGVLQPFCQSQPSAGK